MGDKYVIYSKKLNQYFRGIEEIGGTKVVVPVFVDKIDSAKMMNGLSKYFFLALLLSGLGKNKKQYRFQFKKILLLKASFKTDNLSTLTKKESMLKDVDNIQIGEIK